MSLVINGEEAAELLESLDETAAVLETLLAWHGTTMPPDDLRSRTMIVQNARRLVVLHRGCEGCDGSGVRPDSGFLKDALPEGFVYVERCDCCEKYVDDLAAAAAWGDDAKMHPETGYVIAKPKEAARA